jgi:hypothetical protein
MSNVKRPSSFNAFFSKNFFCQLLTVHGVNKIRHKEIRICTTEPLVPESGSSEAETASLVCEI